MPARNPGQAERHHPGDPRVDAAGGGVCRRVAQRAQRDAEMRLAQPGDGEARGQRHGAARPVVVAQVRLLVERREQRRHGRVAERAAGQPARVVDRHVLDDLREREGQQRRVDAEQAQRGEGQQDGDDGRADAAGQDRQPQRQPCLVQHQPARPVGAQRVDRQLAEVPDAGHAQDEVPGDVQDEDDLGGDDDRHVVRVGVDQREDRGDHDGDADGGPAHRRQRGQRPGHSRVSLGVPRSP